MNLPSSSLTRSARALFPRSRKAWLQRLLLVPLVGLLMAPRCVQTRAVDVSPSYLGTFDARGNCADTQVSYETLGYEPVSLGTKHPLFIYLVGTEGTPGTGHDHPVPMTVAEEMAARGFVALTASYDNGFGALFASNKTWQQRCLFDASLPNSLVRKACALSNVDCNLGIAVWGHSQGGFLAIRAHDLEPRVRAVVAAGVGTNVLPYTLPPERLRLLNGANEFGNNSVSGLIQITGANAPDDCAQSASQCLRTKGSGWVLVPQNAGIPRADHCWFQRNGCSSDYTPAPGFAQQDPGLPYSVGANADWMVSTLLGN